MLNVGDKVTVNIPLVDRRGSASMIKKYHGMRAVVKRLTLEGNAAEIETERGQTVAGHNGVPYTFLKNWLIK